MEENKTFEDGFQMGYQQGIEVGRANAYQDAFSRMCELFNSNRENIELSRLYSNAVEMCKALKNTEDS